MKSYVLTLLLFLIGVAFEANAATEEILLKLARRCRESQSDAVLIVHNGKAVFEYRSDPYWQPIDTMSMTKSLAVLAIGLLIQEGAITGVDVPVYRFFPEWEQGHKKKITIRHLLSHTSGLQAEFTSEEIYRAPDCIQLALCAELASTPGSAYFYNNKAANLLAGIVKNASGLSLSEYLKQNLFDPMEIENVAWQCDSSHNDYAMAHVTMTAPDLAKIGDLVAHQGAWCGRQLISPNFMALLNSPGQTYNPFSGHFWWIDYYSIGAYWDDALLDRYKSCGVNPKYIQSLKELQGRVIAIQDRLHRPTGELTISREITSILGGHDQACDFFKQVSIKQLPVTHWLVSGPKSYAALGYWGQQLLIYPSTKIVAVRQARPKGVEESKVDLFPDFGALVEELALRSGY